MIQSAERAQERDEAAEITTGTATPYQTFYRLCYARLDLYTKGHAAEVMRLGSFLFVGGLGALVNLGCVWLFARYTHLPYDVYVVLATEIALLCNFTLNDRLTFRALGSQRSWPIRCLRFHGPASIGFALTLLLSYAAHHLARLQPVSAQAVAIIIVTFVNFAMHRLWTYRGHTGQKRSADAASF